MVSFLDSTLREGALYQVFPFDINLEIARLVTEYGAEVLEIPLPYRTSKTQTNELVASVRERSPETLVVLHGRAYEQDIEAMKDFEVDGGTSYLAASSSHRQHKLHAITREDAERRLLEAADLLNEQNWRYRRVTIEDASTLYLEDREFLFHLVKQLARKDVIVGVPDTRGRLFPDQATKFAQDLTMIGAKLSAHNHDDFGFASYNTAIMASAGFHEVQATLMGIGDRNGIADPFVTAIIMEGHFGKESRIRLSEAERIYSKFAGFTGISTNFKHPLSQEARSLSAGVHQTYPPGYFPPEKIRYLNEVNLRATSNLSSKMVDKILRSSGQILESERLKSLTNSIAKKSLELGSDLTSKHIAEIIKGETGFDVDPNSISRHIGQDQVCILVKMKPGSSSVDLKKYAIRLGAKNAHILYGSPYDLMILAPMFVDNASFVDLLREKFLREIDQTLTAIID